MFSMKPRFSIAYSDHGVLDDKTVLFSFYLLYLSHGPFVQVTLHPPLITFHLIELKSSIDPSANSCQPLPFHGIAVYPNCGSSPIKKIHNLSQPP